VRLRTFKRVTTSEGPLPSSEVPFFAEMRLSTGRDEALNFEIRRDEPVSAQVTSARSSSAYFDCRSFSRARQLNGRYILKAAAHLSKYSTAAPGRLLPLGGELRTGMVERLQHPEKWAPIESCPEMLMIRSTGEATRAYTGLNSARFAHRSIKARARPAPIFTVSGPPTPWRSVCRSSHGNVYVIMGQNRSDFP